MNPAPLTRSVNARPPAVADGGFRLEIVGFTANTRTLEVPKELMTVTPLYPADVRKLAGMAAVTCVVLTNVVAWGEPFQRSEELIAENPVPFTVSVKPPLPALMEPGTRLKRVGGKPLCPRINRLVPRKSARTATNRAYWKKALAGGGVLPFMAVDSFSL